MQPFDPERLLKALARRRVRYVLIGAVAARLHGFPRMTADADIAPASDAEDVERLARALHDLDARVYTASVPAGLPFDISGDTLGRARLWSLVTTAARVDVVFEPSGTTGYDDLARSAVAFSVFGIEIQAASLEDILRSMEAAGRPQDRADAIVIRAMLRRKAGRDR